MTVSQIWRKVSEGCRLLMISWKKGFKDSSDCLLQITIPPQACPKTNSRIERYNRPFATLSQGAKIAKIEIKFSGFSENKNPENDQPFGQNIMSAYFAAGLSFFYESSVPIRKNKFFLANLAPLRFRLISSITFYQ